MKRQAFGIAASFYTVSFKADGKTVFEGSGSLGCLRRGRKEDNFTLIRAGLSQLNKAVEGGTAPDGANAYDSVVVRGSEYSRAELVKAGLVAAPKKTVCKGLGPKPRRKK